MNKKILSIMCLFAMTAVSTACGEKNNTSTNSNNSSVSEVSTSSTSSTSSSTSSTSSNSSVSSSNTSSNLSSNTSSSNSSSTDTPEVEEDQYFVDADKRITITLNVTIPETENDVYVIGDFNNWGKFNTLNDSSYKVNDGKITISNVETGSEYSYMYVQKITDATYTYNFGVEKVDSENNQIIGYTSEGYLISQYCISQVDEKFTFTAVENYSSSDVVSEWGQPIYGDTIEVDDPNASYEIPTSGYNLCVKEIGSEKAYYIPLENTGTMDGSGRAQYVAYNITLKKQTALSIYDGNNNTGWNEDNLESYGAYRNFIADPEIGIVCLTEGTYDIYVKLAAGNDSIYICEAGEVNDSLPMNGYGLKVYPASGEDPYFVPLVHVDDFDGFTQYFGDNVVLSSGDIFALYDFANQAEWAEDTLSPYGQYQKFEAVANGIKCNESGTYDIYVKFKWEADEIYIGDQTGA